MRNLIALAGALLLVLQVTGQAKPLIDTGMLGKWPFIPPYNCVALSENGRYVAYIIQNLPVGQATLTVQDLRGSWKKSIVVGKRLRLLFFSADNRKLCWQQGDSTWLQQAGSDQCELLSVSGGVGLSYPSGAQVEWVGIPSKTDSSLRLVNLVNGKEFSFKSVVKHAWVANSSNVLLTTAGSLKWLNLVSGKEHSFVGGNDYALSPSGESMICVTEKGDGKVLRWLDFNKGVPVTIWTGQAGELPGGYMYDKKGAQVAFHVQSAADKVVIFYYKQGNPAAVLRAEDKSTGFAGNLSISGLRGFSDNGRWLFFYVRKKLPQQKSEQVVSQVDIWSYRDEILNPAETRGIKTYHDYAAVMDIAGKNIQLLEQQEDERLLQSKGEVLLLKKRGPDFRIGHWWTHSGQESFRLLKPGEGKSRLINQQTLGLKEDIQLSVSPQSRWFYYWNQELKNYFIVDPHSGQSTNLTAGLPVPVADEVLQSVPSLPVGIAGWYDDDSAVLLYDNYDLWKLDPAGKKAAVNLTDGYGRQHGTMLRLVDGYRTDFRSDQEVLLSGYNVHSKYNGFFRARLDRPESLELLTMGPYTYYQNAIDQSPLSSSLKPLSGGKGNAKRWIVMRQSATEYPNLFVSKDLREFTALTHLDPQKSFNWLRTEVVNWRMYNGQANSGVLYKPENFDSTQKYPVIFNYYEKLSHRCYQFPMPGLTGDNINIPWFVSRGYLVFTPDIQYTKANSPGGMTTSEAAYNAVASAAEHLSQRSYVNPAHLAVQGHSFGGHETGGIITNSRLFAAAAAMAGGMDNLSGYLTLVTLQEGKDATEKHHKQGHSQGRMGATPWERPDLYRRNSAVLNADKITTPLLLTHNKTDGSINFRQGVEMYMALRRLSKPCWLLQYDNSGHGLYNNDALDYTIRLTQYFDHYLKGKPAPEWMTGNTLAPYKGRSNLYGLDPAGNCCRSCHICEKWNKQKGTGLQRVTNLPPTLMGL